MSPETCLLTVIPSEDDEAPASWIFMLEHFAAPSARLATKKDSIAAGQAEAVDVRACQEITYTRKPLDRWLRLYDVANGHACTCAGISGVDNKFRALTQLSIIHYLVISAN